MVFYQKYRSKNLDELIGQETVKQTLLTAFQAGKLSHAYLFTGPRGTGKTSTARILAKMVNCEDKSPPCNKCSTCLSITDGSNLDLIEIDAASNRGIDDIRALRETIKLSPSSGQKKVYIIDEVHMLTTEAFNALLKTLEEPPSHCLFILATTDLHKIPSTILSRVTKLNFHEASSADLVKALKKVVGGENLTASDDALLSIANSAQGSFRDAIKLLDQLASTNQEISLKLVQDNLKVSSFEVLVNLTQQILAKNSTKALELVLEQVSQGINIKDFILSEMYLLRDLLLMKEGVGGEIKADLGSLKYQKLVEILRPLSVTGLIKTLKYFQTALENIKTPSIPSLPLEIAVIESCQPALPTGSIAIPARSDETEARRAQTRIHQSHPDPESDNKKPDDIKITDSPSDLSALKDKWAYILETIKPYNYSLEALLRSSKILNLADSKLTLEVPYSFHQRILETPRNQTLLESVLADVLGKQVKIDCVLGTRPVRVEELANIEVAADDEIIKIASEIFNS